ncbi:MAG: hypothetical protein R6W86_04275 [Marinobacter sp.]|uniref:hypothetical protein n=1 Tax=Marinobacter sp. TaxID=50741 RepID=UPI00396E5073
MTATCLSIALVAAIPAHGGLLDGETQQTGSEPTLQAGDIVPGRYILRLDPELPSLLGVADLRAGVDAILVAVGGGEILHLYQTALTQCGG